MTARLPFTPLIIVGAGRSGTNMLRDAVTALDGFGTWPCDEINPIWRHGNLDWPDDAIPADRADRAARFIRGRFHKIWQDTGRPDVVVEKTCANSLRVPFVKAVLPEARIVHILRNGVDVVASARKRWRGEMEIAPTPYLAAKLRYTPPSDLPVYAWSFLRNRIAMRRHAEGRMRTWGPRFPALAQMLRDDAPLDEICGAQWVACAGAADAALQSLPDAETLTLHYEETVAHPVAALARVCALAGRPQPESELARAAASIRARPGKARPDAEVAEIAAMIRPTLDRFGYGDTA